MPDTPYLQAMKDVAEVVGSITSLRCFIGSPNRPVVNTILVHEGDSNGNIIDFHGGGFGRAELPLVLKPLMPHTDVNQSQERIRALAHEIAGGLLTAQNTSMTLTGYRPPTVSALSEFYFVTLNKQIAFLSADIELTPLEISYKET